jgi:hypothetical protein
VKAIVASCFLVLAAPALADEILFDEPASMTQLFCSDQVVVVGRVKEGTSEDCRLRMASPCGSQENQTHLSVTVSEVLAVRNGWDKGRFPMYDPALAPRHVGELVGRTLELEVAAISGADFAATDTEPDGPDLHNPTDAPLTDADIGRLYVGKQFIFTLEPLNSPGDLYSSGAWSLKSRNWAINTMRRAAGRDCPELLENQGRSFRGNPTADSPNRQALVSQIETQLAHLTESPPGGVLANQSLGLSARDMNPRIEEATWKALETEVESATFSMMTKRGSSFDVGLRTLLDTLSTAELRKISAASSSKNLSDPALVKLGAAIQSSENSGRIDFGNANVVWDDAIKSVLEKHGLKVSP